jgi:hypothetical protein
MAIVFGLLAMAGWSAALAGTVFTDNFTTDSSLGSEWYNMSNTTAASFALNPTAGQGLALTVSAGTGKVNEEFAQFAVSPISLAVGDSISLVVNFNAASGMATDTGGLLAGLYNTQGTVATGGELTTATGGATADDKGYFGIMGYNTTAGTSTKFYDRNGAAAAPNELGYYSTIGASYYTQLSSFAASGNANLANSTAYTLTYTVLNNGGSDTITAVISQGATQLDSWTTTDASGLYNSFDELDFGSYGKAGPVNLNITSISVLSSVPEPSIFAFAALGLLGFITRFRRR